MNRSRCLAALLTVASAMVSVATAATPPSLVNYQGVLRDPNGVPISGSRDMVFTFFDDPNAGNEILVDSHTAGATVMVDGGLFNVALGGGIVSDGTGAGTYLDLAGVFRDFGQVWMKIEVAGETLDPRVQVLSAAYALNSSNLGGKPAADFLDTSAAAQTKAGDLTVQDLTLTGAMFSMGDGSSLQGFSNALIVYGGDSPAGQLVLGASTDPTTSYVWVRDNPDPAGEGGIVMDSEDGRYQFLSPASFVTFHFSTYGSSLVATASDLKLRAGEFNTDTLTLHAGNDATDGSLVLLGDGAVTVTSGSGQIDYVNGATSATTAGLDPSGNLQIDGDITVSGDQVLFGVAGASVSAAAAGLTVTAGAENTDDLLLQAGNDATDGGLTLAGDGAATLTAGDGQFNFVNGSTGVTTASISSSGALDLGGSLVFDLTGSVAKTIQAAEDLRILKGWDTANLSAFFNVYTDGGTIEQMRIQDGDEAATLFDGAVTANGLDYAETFLIQDATLEAGDLVAILPQAPGHVRRTARSYAADLIGVISGRPGFVTGDSFDAEEAADAGLAELRRQKRERGEEAAAKAITLELTAKKNERQRSVALLGRLPVKVDGAYGEIRAGDPLTSSPTPGHAMAMTRPGRGLGIALEGFDGAGPGMVLAFIQPGYYEPEASLAEAARTEPTAAPRDVAGLPAGRPRAGEQAFPAADVMMDDQPPGKPHPTDPCRGIDGCAVFVVAEVIEPGELLALDPQRSSELVLAAEPADPGVIGVAMDRAVEIEGRLHVPVISHAFAEVKADAGYGAIRAGDLLTASPTPGHAMRSSDPRPGTVIGKAIEPLEAGTGVIRVLLMMR